MNDCPASQDCPLPCWVCVVGSRVDSHKLDVAGKPVARGNKLRRRFAFVVKTPAPFGGAGVSFSPLPFGRHGRRPTRRKVTSDPTY